MEIRTRMLWGLIVLIAHSNGLPYGEPFGQLQKRAVPFSQTNFVGSDSNAFAVPLQLGCAAALICVEERFCTMDGTISTEPVELTSKQLLRRVPMSSCRNPDNGVVGKCCRDPNYVDPWPAGNLPANYSGGFDEQGFPTFLNIAKVKPPKPVIKVPSTTARPPPVYKPEVRPIEPQQTQDFSSQQTLEQIPNFLPETPQFPDVPRIPLIPEAPYPAPEIPEIPLVPHIPDNSNHAPQAVPYPKENPAIKLIPRPFTKNHYDVASSNQNPTLIAPYPKVDQCGIRNDVPRPDGLQNPQAAFGEIPWQAMILSNTYRKILCSGVIIEPNVVLTAASCVDGLPASEISIKSGEWKLGYELKHEEPLPFEIVNVTQIKIHPNYVKGSSSDDTAMLILERPVSLNFHVNMLCLPHDLQIQETRDCIVTGWGQQIIELHAAGAIMNSVDVDLLEHNVCEDRLLGAESQLNINENMICAKSHKRNNNMCQTDIGSPLACRNENGIYELMGIHSQDTGCLPTNQVAAFAPIDKQWIKSVVQPTKPVENKAAPSTPEQKIVEPIVQEAGYDYRKSYLPPRSNQYLPPV